MQFTVTQKQEEKYLWREYSEKNWRGSVVIFSIELKKKKKGGGVWQEKRNTYLTVQNALKSFSFLLAKCQFPPAFDRLAIYKDESTANYC